jgi:hypothetical protein
MSATKWVTSFYWLGVSLSVGCVALVFSGDRTDTPLSWVLGGFAIAAFLAAELCHLTSDGDVEETAVMSRSPESKTWSDYRIEQS